jgi:hypothetical protein
MEALTRRETAREEISSPTRARLASPTEEQKNVLKTVFKVTRVATVGLGTGGAYTNQQPARKRRR